MRCFAANVLALGLGLCTLVSCSAILGYDESNPSGGGTATSTTGTGGHAGSGGGPTGNAGGSAGSGAGAQAGTGGTAGSGGEACHDVCTAGSPLPVACGSCEQAVCSAAPPCCDDEWTWVCALRAGELCGVDCSNACSELFGLVTGYHDCGLQNGNCTFISAAGQSCDGICAHAETVCQGAYINTTSCADMGSPVGCGVASGNPMICLCGVP
jgi:hypothetical protein